MSLAPIAQVRLIAEWRDLLSKVSDQQALLASLRDSPYFAPFKDTAAQYETKLARLGDALQALNQVRGPKEHESLDLHFPNHHALKHNQKMRMECKS